MLRHIYPLLYFGLLFIEVAAYPPVCPPDRPYWCLPHYECFNPLSYCDSQSKTVRSCFPSGDDEFLLNWCLQDDVKNGSSLPDPSCIFACVNKFGVISQNFTDGKVTVPSISNNGTSCTGLKPYSCFGECYAPYSFCDHSTKNVKSCFPFDSDRTNYEWCQQMADEKLPLRHVSCRYACKSKYGELGKTNNITDDTRTILIVVLIFVVFIFLILMVGAICWMKSGKTFCHPDRRKNTTPGDVVNQGENNPLVPQPMAPVPAPQQLDINPAMYGDRAPSAVIAESHANEIDNVTGGSLEARQIGAEPDAPATVEDIPLENRPRADTADEILNNDNRPDMVSFAETQSGISGASLSTPGDDSGISSGVRSPTSDEDGALDSETSLMGGSEQNANARIGPGAGQSWNFD